MEKTTLIILAGGKSSRFGRDKSLLELDGRRIVETTVEKCRPVFDEIMISSNQPSKFGIPGIRELSDTYLEMGPMGGIHSALSVASNDAVFFAACDMPFFNTELARYIIENSADVLACIPRFGEKDEPLFGVYRRSLLPTVTRLLDEQRRSLRNLLDAANARILDCTAWIESHKAENAFYNMNYESDFESIKKA